MDLVASEEVGRRVEAGGPDDQITRLARAFLPRLTASSGQI
ncbi:hypothetical protein [Deinococcus aestuarii]|nr:hypothetical protein [Deinococcus aestuarii]